jgi:hypothetical protein
MDRFNRRDFLRGSGVAAAAASLALPADLMAASAQPAPARGWDAGSVQHLLPTVSDSRMLIKASFRTPLMEAPTLHIGGTAVRGRMTDTRGAFWQFHAVDLKPGRPYMLALSVVPCRPIRQAGPPASGANGIRTCSAPTASSPPASRSPIGSQAGSSSTIA